MRYQLLASLIALGFFAAVLGMHKLGRWLGGRGGLRVDKDEASGFGILDGAVFALLGLLIAFTFSGAASRFDDRRKLIIDEANAIGTAWLRIDLLPADRQPQVRETFRGYLDARLAAYRALPDMQAARAHLSRSVQLQGDLWSQSVAAAAGSNPATMLLLPALNESFDIAATRAMATEMHPPAVIFLLLFAFSLLSALIAGHTAAAAGGSQWLHSGVFAIVLAGAVYVIIDMEYPRLGFIRVDSFDQALVDVRQSMK